MPMRPDAPPHKADPAVPGKSASVPNAPPDIAIAELEHGFEVEGEKARPARWRPSVLLISLIVGGLLAIAATVFEIF